VRRIEALTGPGAYQHVKREERVLADTAARLKARPMELADKVDKLAEASHDLEREVKRLQARLLGGTLERLLESTVDVNGVGVVGAWSRQETPRACGSLVTPAGPPSKRGCRPRHARDGKVTWVTMVTKDLVGEFTPAPGERTGQTDGGRRRRSPRHGGGGGKDPAKIPEALAKLPELVSGH